MSTRPTEATDAYVRVRDDGLPYAVAPLRRGRPVLARVVHWCASDATTWYHVATRAGRHLLVTERAGRWRFG